MEARQGSEAPAVMPRIVDVLGKMHSLHHIVLHSYRMNKLQVPAVFHSSPLQPLRVRWDRYGGCGSQLQTPYSYRWGRLHAQMSVRDAPASVCLLCETIALLRPDVTRVASSRGEEKEKGRKRTLPIHGRYKDGLIETALNIGVNRDPHLKSDARQVC